MGPHDKPLRWLHGMVRTPPLSSEARIEAGYLLQRLQRGESRTGSMSTRSQALPDSVRRARQRRLKDYDDE